MKGVKTLLVIHGTIMMANTEINSCYSQ